VARARAFTPVNQWSHRGVFNWECQKLAKNQIEKNNSLAMKRGFLFVMLLCSACGDQEIELMVGERLQDALESTPEHREKIQNLTERVQEQEKGSERERLQKNLRSEAKSLRAGPQQTPIRFFADHSQGQSRIIVSSNDLLINAQSIHDDTFASVFREQAGTSRESIVLVAQNLLHLQRDAKIHTNGRSLVLVANKILLEGDISTTPSDVFAEGGDLTLITYALEIYPEARVQLIGGKMPAEDCLEQFLYPAPEIKQRELSDHVRNSFFYLHESQHSTSLLDSASQARLLQQLGVPERRVKHWLYVDWLLKTPDSIPRLWLPGHLSMTNDGGRAPTGSLQITTGTEIDGRLSENLISRSLQPPPLQHDFPLSAADHSVRLPNRALNLPRSLHIELKDSFEMIINPSFPDFVLDEVRLYALAEPSVRPEQYIDSSAHSRLWSPSAPYTIEIDPQLDPIQFRCESPPTDKSQVILINESRDDLLLPHIQRLDLPSELLPASFRFFEE